MGTAQYFCATCRRHYPGERTVCPADGSLLVEVARDRPRTGSTIDARYVLTDRIAEGGMAAIYRAREVATGERVAMKLLHPRFLTSSRLVELLYQEARIIRAIDHPNVVLLRDFGRAAEGHLFLAMELLRGPTLAEYLWDNDLPPYDVALRIFFQIAEALHAAHSLGVIHADLKASNVLFVTDQVGDERVKVFDFGISRLYDARAWTSEEKRDDLVGGTPQNMSPEQVSGEEVDPRTDLYAAGILLFQLLTGTLPFDDDDPHEVCRMQREDRPPRISDRAPGRRVPGAVQKLVDRLMRKDPEDRPPTAEILVGETKEILRKLGSATQPRMGHLGERGGDGADAEASASRGRTPFSTPPLTPPPAERTGDAGPVGPEPAPEAQARAVTLLDVQFRGDEKPFTLLDPHALQLVCAPLVEAFRADVRSAGGVVLDSDAYRLRAAFGDRDPSTCRAGPAIDLALVLLSRARMVEAGLRIGLAARCGVASGTLFRNPKDRLPPDVLVRGALPDISARLVRLAPWGGLVMDALSYRTHPGPVGGARASRVRARGAADGTAIYTFVGGRAN